MKNKEMRKDEQIAKSIEELNYGNEENLKQRLLEHFKVEFTNPVDDKLQFFKPIIEFEVDGIRLDYDFEKYDTRSKLYQTIVNAVEKRLMQPDLHPLFRHTLINDNTQQVESYVYHISWDKLRDILSCQS